MAAAVVVYGWTGHHYGILACQKSTLVALKILWWCLIWEKWFLLPIFSFVEHVESKYLLWFERRNNLVLPEKINIHFDINSVIEYDKILWKPFLCTNKEPWIFTNFYELLWISLKKKIRMFMRKNKIEDPEFCFSLSRKQMVSRLHFAGILMVADR